MYRSWRFRLKFLGSPQVIVNGEPVHLGSNKGLALLAYLARQGAPVSRDTLDSIFWPESERKRARRSLREELSRLNALLPQGTLLSVAHEVSLDPALPVDVWEFGQALAAGDWEQAVALYAGDLLEGVFVRNAAGFEQWLQQERADLQHSYLQALQALARKAAACGDLQAALAYSRQIINTDQLSEAPYLEAMRWASELGEAAVALDIYQRLQHLLDREFSLRPSAAASGLARWISEHHAAADLHQLTSPADVIKANP